MRYLNWISEEACRGVHTTFISVHRGEGREMRHGEIKKLRTKRSVQCLQPPSCWINTSVRAWGQLKAFDNSALQVWVSFISLCNSGFPTAPGPTSAEGFHGVSPISLLLEELRAGHWVPAVTISTTGRAVGWELLSWHNTRDPQQQLPCPAQQDRPWGVSCWKAELP